MKERSGRYRIEARGGAPVVLRPAAPGRAKGAVAEGLVGSRRAL